MERYGAYHSLLCLNSLSQLQQNSESTNLLVEKVLAEMAQLEAQAESRDKVISLLGKFIRS